MLNSKKDIYQNHNYFKVFKSDLESLGSFDETQIAGSHQRTSYSLGLGRSLRTHKSDNFTDDAAAAHVWDHILRNSDLGNEKSR